MGPNSNNRDRIERRAVGRVSSGAPSVAGGTATPKAPPTKAPPTLSESGGGPRCPTKSQRRTRSDLIVTMSRGASYRRANCPHLGGHEATLFRPCVVCTPTEVIPAPHARNPTLPYGGRAEIAVMQGETEFHSASCLLGV